MTNICKISVYSAIEALVPPSVRISDSLYADYSFEVAADYNNCIVILATIRIICGDRNVATTPQRVHKAQIQTAHGPIEAKLFLQ
jgi:hypothetical protein